MSSETFSHTSLEIYTYTHIHMNVTHIYICLLRTHTYVYNTQIYSRTSSSASHFFRRISPCCVCQEFSHFYYTRIWVGTCLCVCMYTCVDVCLFAWAYVIYWLIGHTCLYLLGVKQYSNSNYIWYKNHKQSSQLPKQHLKYVSASYYQTT